jgi:hypothetical protein
MVRYRVRVPASLDLPRVPPALAGLLGGASFAPQMPGEVCLPISLLVPLIQDRDGAIADVAVRPHRDTVRLKIALMVPGHACRSGPGDYHAERGRGGRI